MSVGKENGSLIPTWQSLSKPAHHSRSCLLYITIANGLLTLATAAISITVWLLVGWNVHSRPADGTRPSSAPLICLPCSDLVLGPLDDTTALEQSMVRHVENTTGTEVCCSSDVLTAAQMLEQAIERRIRIAKSHGKLTVPKYIMVQENDTEAYLSNWKPAAHMMAPTYTPPGGQYPDPHTLTPLLDWTYDSDRGFLRSGVIYRGGRLVVPRNGLYYIYSHLGFNKRLLGNKDAELKLNRVDSSDTEHFIYRNNIMYPNGGEERLMATRQTMTTNDNSSGYSQCGSYVAGVIYLREGDEVYVKVSNVQALSHDHSENYFGFFMV